MPRSTFSAGNAGASSFIALNRNQGGGTKKQGLPPSTGHNANINYNRAYGNNINLVFHINQLGGVGSGRSAFSPSADGVRNPSNFNIISNRIQSNQWLSLYASPSLPVNQGFDVVEAKNTNSNGLMSTCMGDKEYSAFFQGYTFWFKNNENRITFEDNPESYIPAAGGFCSWSVSEELWKVAIAGKYIELADTYAVPDVTSDGYFAVLNDVLYTFLLEGAYSYFISTYETTQVQEQSTSHLFVPKPTLQLRIEALNAIWSKNIEIIDQTIGVFATNPTPDRD
jgi:YHS domain-containing protein